MMRERLLICNDCGEDHWFDKVLLQDWIKEGAVCLRCGEATLQDHGWCDVS